jgi:hypothetical protein
MLTANTEMAFSPDRWNLFGSSTRGGGFRSKLRRNRNAKR